MVELDRVALASQNSPSRVGRDRSGPVSKTSNSLNIQFTREKQII